ncbi:DNA polymerase-3 subunit epsilon [Brevibacterium sandarakinum]|uniref:DNA polymerase-3 subunit epsilon n=2 Tax=Brevibacterium sandarakinum TaxID=629680 RepID=A0A1H1Y6D2_BRESA|nr:DNA polymerase-3 subunit epsilon [Brevibacterium sandarakinum]
MIPQSTDGPMSRAGDRLGHMSAPFDRSATAIDSSQLSFDNLGTPLHEVTFVIVDLETTGTHAGKSEITEIGAIKTRGGEVLGEFQSLVKPEESVISPFVAQLTGITHAMVDDAPSIRSVLPSFLEFSVGAVLVAHNAPFDIGFLRSACEKLDYHWPQPTVLDTVTLSRRVVGRDEVRNHKLSTLSAHFGTEVSPDHRALSDAQATGEVLHRVLERFGGYGITTLEELATVRQAGWAKRQAKSHLAKGVPAEPGVYMFLDGTRRVLYIGKSGNMARRVRGYFNASENRGRMAEMITAAQEVSCLPCAHALEAEVREIRLIGELAPPYNRRSKNPERNSWIVLSDETFPRLSVVRSNTALEKSPATPLGPFRSRKSAQAVKELLDTLYPVKRCTAKITAANLDSHRPCVSSQVGQCGGPCAGVTDRHRYLAEIAELFAVMAGDFSSLRRLCTQRMSRLAEEARYETAAEVRDAMRSALSTAARAESVRALRDIPEILAYAPGPEGGLDLGVIRHGKLAAASHARGTQSIEGGFAAIRATAEWVPAPGKLPAATDSLAEETRLLAQWLQSATLTSVQGAWSLPCTGANYHAQESGPVRLGDPV